LIRRKGTVKEKIRNGERTPRGGRHALLGVLVRGSNEKQESRPLKGEKNAALAHRISKAANIERAPEEANEEPRQKRIKCKGKEKGNFKISRPSRWEGAS